MMVHDGPPHTKALRHRGDTDKNDQAASGALQKPISLPAHDETFLSDAIALDCAGLGWVRRS